MATVTKSNIPKLYGKMSFNVWKLLMMAILTQNGLKKAIGRK